MITVSIDAKGNAKTEKPVGDVLVSVFQLVDARVETEGSVRVVSLDLADGSTITARVDVGSNTFNINSTETQNTFFAESPETSTYTLIMRKIPRC